MPGMPSWPDDHSQVIGQGSFSPGHPRYLMIDPPESKSLPTMNSKLLSRRNSVALRAFPLPGNRPSTSHLAQLPLDESHEHSPPTPSHSLPTAFAPNLESRSPFKTHRYQTSCRGFSPTNF